MNVLIIPSWYPYAGHTMAGKFFVDQAKALAMHTRHNYYLLNFGQNEYQLKFRTLPQNLSKLYSYAKAKRQLKQLAQNLWELRIPHLSWSSYIAKGNLDSFPLDLDLKVDLIYALVSFPAGYLAMRLAASWNIPYIIAEHSGPFPFPQFLHKGKLSKLLAIPLKNAKTTIVVSSYLQDQLDKYAGVKAHVIPNMVNTDFFVPTSDKKKSAQLRLFAMSSFTHQKGVTILMQALYALWQIDPAFEMVWAGDGPLHKTITRQAAGLPITFTKELSPQQALGQYQNCDLFLMPSLIESFSMVLIEAMSCGVPSVATACGGPADIITPDTGILCAPNSSSALLNAILEYKSKSERYDANLIRAHCISNYSEKAVSSQLNSLFEDSVSL